MRRTRVVVTATAVAVMAGLLGVPAQAAPAASASPAASAAVQAAPESTMEDKVRAAAALGIVAGDDLLILSDRNFVIALWRQATGAEVRASAELAFAGSDGECTQWIKTGIHEAKRRDDIQEQRDAEVARAARELKQHAAATIGIAAEPELLIQSYKDFVYALWQRATGPKVKAAALVAFGASEADQKEFLLNGIVAAHAQDQQDKIDADKEATEAEKARLAARDAKSRAAAVLGIVATENLLVLSDENFVREMWNRAVPGSEIAVAAERALRSAVPADWKAFIDTGIYDANKRDIAIALQKKQDADKRRLQEIRTKAANSGVHSELVAAADRALGGTPDDIDTFLRVGQYADAVLRQSLWADSKGTRGFQIRGDAGAQAVISFGRVNPEPGDGLDATWKVVPGLADFDCHSFESATKPGVYLRQLDLKVLIAASDGSDRFRADATWCSKPGQWAGGVTLESKGQPGRFLRHSGGKVYAANKSGANPFDAAANFEIESFWRVFPATPATTAIERRWLNDDAVRVIVGDPVDVEKIEGSLRYRDYQRGRLTWSQATGVKEMRGNILTEYKQTGVVTSPIYGAPSTDETGTPDGIGRYNHFAGGGSIYWTANTGAHLVYGAIKDRWRALDWERSYLGYPAADPINVPGGTCSNFQHGSISWNSTTGKVVDSRSACSKA
ncbi:LGFP repeat-containing protein [Amycolatopsis xylanica]|uniref:LGFP repeat-containing protein n=1 Tax=Amycolatopsis xylanica TaxID=589385 RepID=A0A1H2YXU2_9PSEU|nr:AbfB domain-containing protein [Amycolatopsis xylanica]SDX09464.1 LGFP repeat-containing protein [Amycolatopsis xylanica]